LLRRRGDLPEERVSRLESLGFNWSPLDGKFERNFALLERYVAEHGHADVPALHVIDGVRLGEWCSNQRTLRRKGELPEERVSRLESLGFNWSPLDGKFERNFALLERYVAEHGHADVPALHVIDGVRLGEWCSNQRTLRRMGELPEERVSRLESLGFNWSPLDGKFERNFALLERYVAEHGHADVPGSYVKDGVKLGGWCIQQRQLRRRGDLPEERVSRLESLGFNWSPFDGKFECSFALLERYVAEHGHSAVPESYVADGVKLSQWCSRQRQLRQTGQLPEERVSRLEALGFAWNPRGDSFERSFALLERYVAEHGHADVPGSYVADGVKLGRWCIQQRQLRRRGDLPEERVSRLEALGFNWTPLDGKFERSFALLERYVAEHGHSAVPESYVADGVKLSQWCSRQRQLRQTGQLPEERVSRLEALGFAWNPRGDSFERSFALLERYVAEHGHADVPGSYVADGVKLGGWCSNQRQLRRRGDLPEERVRRLEALGFNWTPLDGKFARNFALLERYVAEHGHADVPGSYVADGVKLGGWCKEQRTQYKKKRLPADRVRCLESVGFRFPRV
ncbi:helicase associated domain-containing protein, partial [Burkholderia stagnalis]|uniref:helicase associated domain-containing protein n=1 Tax=Burkholderia stagnalis TaxID=1503054 RepID=UPI000FA05F9E